MNGYLYVLMNPKMDGLVKIGKTTRDTKSRAKELSTATGVPTPFVVVYEEYFEDCSKAEEFVHSLLELRGHRLSSNKEFFSASSTDAIKAILEAKKTLGTRDIPEEVNDPQPQITSASGQEALNLGDQYYNGTGTALQDYSEALVYYEKASRLGVASAFLKIGKMYLYGNGCDKNQGKALEYFKQGANAGVGMCYAEMAQIYMEQKHQDNADKCWLKYFESQSFQESGLRGAIGFGYFTTLAFADIPFAGISPGHIKYWSRIRDEILEAGKYRIDFNIRKFPEERKDLIVFYQGVVERIKETI